MAGRARLTNAGDALIDNWTAHSTAEDKGTISLEANKLYDFKLEYFQSGGNAVMNEKIEDAFMAMPKWAPANRTGANVAIKLKQTVMIGAN